MKSFCVTQWEAERYYQKRKKYRATLRDKLRKRLPGVFLCEELRFGVRAFRQERTERCLAGILKLLLCYCLGGKIADLLFAKNRDESERMLAHFTPENNQRLFHWTPSEKLERIWENGLIPGGGCDYVYLTDDPDYLAGTAYFYWKVRRAGRDTKFVLLEIDACSLAKEHEIFWVDTLHEFGVDKVPKECLVRKQDGE